MGKMSRSSLANARPSLHRARDRSDRGHRSRDCFSWFNIAAAPCGTPRRCNCSMLWVSKDSACSLAGGSAGSHEFRASVLRMTLQISRVAG